MHLLNNPRRSHRKSRYGCALCKRRHVKCDEKRPSCTPCLVRGQDCTYLMITQRKATSDAPSRDRLGLPSPCPRARTDLVLHEMQLFHHALMVTAPSIANDDLDLRFWQMDIPRIAITHAFVMDSLLAVAALHLAYIHPEQQTHWASVSLTYQIAATTGLREDLAAGLNDGLEAKFAGSALVLVLTTAYPAVCSNTVIGQERAEKQGYTLDTVQSIRSALEGCAIMATHIHQDQDHSSFGYWLHRGLSTPETVHQKSELQARLHHLRNEIERSEIEASSRDECQRVCDINLSILDLWPAHQFTIVWPLWVSKAFLALCRKGDWVAYILLLFYGLTLHLDSHKWYISGAGKQLILNILSRMGDKGDIPLEWAETICWVRQVVDV
ncbi:hypothetical protein BO79DRAFT_156442 [Aspergillus costaricaensis CBS 115574]|uniref:Uncharacterized protein n=1 Tax=Aspergillus costaricaensis CBS 115574 TaxID=1448317 RepID=A0ACD1I3X8_9EURO|nr:hypothetical protein BO79DRAFT_156442 [Aspergillus costaricaensis CBS 115574]RAK85203.1 hypothetical protein BO79DRAFT_156442 [Aspergillus costaricaensis CBS 115574]